MPGRARSTASWFWTILIVFKAAVSFPQQLCLWIWIHFDMHSLLALATCLLAVYFPFSLRFSPNPSLKSVQAAGSLHQAHRIQTHYENFTWHFSRRKLPVKVFPYLYFLSPTPWRKGDPRPATHLSRLLDALLNEWPETIAAVASFTLQTPERPSAHRAWFTAPAHNLWQTRGSPRPAW